MSFKFHHHFLLLLLFITIFLILLTAPSIIFFISAKPEKLPWWAWLNRTVYPVVHNYTGPRGKPELAIGLISDVQYAEKEEQDRRHFKKSPQKLQQCVAEMNANRTHLDLVMHLGDLVDHSMEVYGPPMLDILSKLNYPLYHVLGNHDYLGTPEDKLEDVPKRLGMPRNYYSMLAGKNKRYRLIILDGNDLSMYATKKGSSKRKQSEDMMNRMAKLGAKHGKPFNGGIGEEQLYWLKQQLGEACRMGQRAVIFLHQGLRPEGERTNLWNDFVLVQTISTFHCLAAVINGHAHKFLYDFKYTKYRQVHFITFGGMVQSPFTSFGFADFYDDELHIHGLIFGRQIEYHLNLSMHQKPEMNKNFESENGNGEKLSQEEKIEKRRKSRMPTVVSPTNEEVVVSGEETSALFPTSRVSGMLEEKNMNDQQQFGFYGATEMTMLTILCLSLLAVFIWWMFGGGRKMMHHHVGSKK